MTLQVNAPCYQTGETITVTLNNQSCQTIYFPDHLTNCTVILLVRQVVQPLSDDTGVRGGVNPCRLAIATRTHALPAGQHLLVQLVPPVTGWPAALYRATLSYHTSLNAGLSTTIFSGWFQVGPSAPPEP